MTEIVKVQRPLHTTDPNNPWLMYDLNRKYQIEVPDKNIPQHVKEAMGNDYKAYFNGEWSSLIGWSLFDRVSDDQDF